MSIHLAINPLFRKARQRRDPSTRPRTRTVTRTLPHPPKPIITDSPRDLSPGLIPLIAAFHVHPDRPHGWLVPQPVAVVGGRFLLQIPLGRTVGIAEGIVTESPGHRADETVDLGLPAAPALQSLTRRLE